MAINSNTFINTINTRLANTTLANTDIDNAIISVKIFNSINPVVSVFSTSNLPRASQNEGRMIYVTNDAKYYYSDGTSWITDFTPKEFGSGLLTFGCGRFGMLGTGDANVDRCSPTSVVGGFTDWKDVSAGVYHTTALRTDGTLWSWGDSGNGRTGLNSATDFCSPMSVVGGFTDWCQLSSGFFTTAAVRTNGTLWSWGGANYGVLGDGTTVSKSSPVSVIGGFTDWCQVSVGSSNHTLALRTNGTLWTWGVGGAGRLGDGTTVSKSSPVSVVGGFTDWCQVSAGASHSAGIRMNGTLWTWGCGRSGALGDGTTVNKCSPVSVVGGFTDWCQVSAGGIILDGHMAAIRTNGTLWTWGIAAAGQLGNGDTLARCSPVSVVGGFTDWCQVSAGSAIVAGIRTNGTLWAWGYNRAGSLGDGTTVNRCSPVSTIAPYTWCKVSVSPNIHTAAIKLNELR